MLPLGLHRVVCYVPELHVLDFEPSLFKGLANGACRKCLVQLKVSSWQSQCPFAVGALAKSGENLASSKQKRAFEVQKCVSGAPMI